jgi:hypothetical protein
MTSVALRDRRPEADDRPKQQVMPFMIHESFPPSCRKTLVDHEAPEAASGLGTGRAATGTPRSRTITAKPPSRYPAPCAASTGMMPSDWPANPAVTVPATTATPSTAPRAPKTRPRWLPATSRWISVRAPATSRSDDGTRGQALSPSSPAHRKLASKACMSASMADQLVGRSGDPACSV